jgi:hypothetical protein
LFEIEDLGPQPLAGFAEPQPAWRVIGESGVVSRFADEVVGRRRDRGDIPGVIAITLVQGTKLAGVLRSYSVTIWPVIELPSRFLATRSLLASKRCSKATVEE